MNGFTVFQLYHWITGIFGMFLNIVLLYVSLFQSPLSIRTYSILIINFALSDMLCAFFSLFIEQRIIPVEHSLVHVSYGFCHHLGPKWCYASYSIMLHFFTHSLYSLLVSFAYRYYILLNGSPTPKKLTMILLLVYLPSFAQCVTFYSTLGEQDETYSLLKTHFPHYDIDIKLVTGNNNVLAPASVFAILQMCVPTFPIYISILVLISKIKNKLQQSTEHLRKETKVLHSQLLKALTYQSLLPAFFGCGITMFIIEQSKLFIHPFLEFSIFSVLTMIPLLSPLIYLYYVAPYRRAIVRIFVKEKKSIVQSSISRRKSRESINTIQNITVQ